MSHSWTFYQLQFGRFRSPEIDEDWLETEGWGKLFCRKCGSRLPSVKSVDVKIAGTSFPYVIGSYGLPDVGFGSSRLLDSLGVDATRYLWLGRVIGVNGKVVPSVHTFTGKKRQVPIRGREPLLEVGCNYCRQPVFLSRPKQDRYIVSKEGLGDPLYESNEACLVVRSDVYERIESTLDKRINVEPLLVLQRGLDGRTETELEYHECPQGP